ncbi:MAG TPA: hypothetical protein VLS90_09500, partial [Thermodesulfobacteriota bacterium]|nr:hypothetical protein [Thermodesulfobacteriota bacterium]
LDREREGSMKRALGVTVIILCLSMAASPLFADTLMRKEMGFLLGGEGCDTSMFCSRHEEDPQQPLARAIGHSDILDVELKHLSEYSCYVIFANPLHGLRDQTINIGIKVYRPHGGLMHSRSGDFEVKSDWDQVFVGAGCGWGCYGQEEEGVYAIRVFLAGDIIGEKFVGVGETIFDDILLKEDPFEIGRELALKGEYDASKHLWGVHNQRDGGDRGYSNCYFPDNESVYFIEEHLESGLITGWSKDATTGRYHRRETDGATNETGPDTMITQIRAWQAGWRILAYFNR